MQGSLRIWSDHGTGTRPDLQTVCLTSCSLQTSLLLKHDEDRALTWACVVTPLETETERVLSSRPLSALVLVVWWHFRSIFHTCLGVLPHWIITTLKSEVLVTFCCYDKTPYAKATWKNFLLLLLEWLGVGIHSNRGSLAADGSTGKLRDHRQIPVVLPQARLHLLKIP